MSAEVRAGIVAVLFVAALIGFLLFLRGGVDFRDRGYELRILVDNAGGIAVGAQVQMAGVEIGRVVRVELTRERRAQITVRIRQGVEIPTGSRFLLATTGLLGDRYIAIAPEPGDPRPLDPDTVVTGVAPFSIDELADRVVRVARRTEDALISINRIVGDPELARAVSESVRATRDATAALRRTAESAERIAGALERTAGRDVPAIAAQLQTMAAELAGAAADVRMFAADIAAEGQTARQIRQTVTSIQRAAEGIDRMVRDLQGVVNEQEVRAVRASLTEAREAITQAREAVGEGRAVIRRADETVERIQRVIPERIEFPELRATVGLEYGVWFDGRRLGHDVILTLLPDAATTYLFTFREFGGVNRFGLQVGSRLDPRLRLRYGVVDSHLGLGLDYQASPSFGYSIDLTNISQLTLNAYLRYRIDERYGITLRAQSVFNQPTFGVGVYRRF
jgi:phospholipid/cholesterol/gamma-HCH transport system substrate-binding protein